MSNDPLGLGQESDVVAVPTQWLVVLGPRSSGKSTLIRQMKLAHDGSDVAEMLRFTREIHKVAIDLFKQVARVARETISDEDEKVSLDKLLAVRRRALITLEVASDVRRLWKISEMKVAEDQLADVQGRKACRHYLQRVEALAEPDYVPTALDLLHMPIPTLGQQETRIPSFPGGPLSVFEMANDTRSSTSFAAQTSASTDVLLGTGLRGVVFVASTLDFQIDGYRKSQSRQSRKGFERMFGFSAGEPHLTHDADIEQSISARAEAIKLWHKAQSIATTCNVPCLLVLTKRDLLDASPSIATITTPSEAAAMLQSQYLASVPPEQPMNTIANERVTNVEPENEPKVNNKYSLVIDGLDADQVSDVTQLVLQKAFPEIEHDDEAGAFGEAIHICLCFYGSLDGVLLSKCNVLPVAKWQNHVLRISDHAWLRQLPNPIPNPKTCTEDSAMRLGKNSPCPTRAQFWQALVTLVEQLGGFEPTTLGTLHLSPLLTSSGALLFVLRQEFATAPSFGSFKVRKLKWRPIGQVASKLAQVAQAAELEVYRCAGQLSSYAPEVRAMLANNPVRELLPSVWLERLRLACGATSCSLTPGSYVVAMNTRSSRDGFQILVPTEQDVGAMPPAIKISDSYISSEDWAALCEIGDAAKRGEAATNVPKNWSAAKGWMGPDVGTEKQFTMLQKFFFGVLGLRQILERKCTATRDHLRYSKPMGPTDSISVLGHLCTQDIILADPGGRVQLILICKHHSADDNTPFPKALRWLPFPLFEAQHYARYMPVPYEALAMGLELKQRCAAIQNEQAHASDALRDSLRDSGGSLRASTLTEQSKHLQRRKSIDQQLSDQNTATDAPLQAVPCVFEEAWNALRWTRWVVHEMCLNDDDEVASWLAKRMGERSSVCEDSTLPFHRRLERHTSLYQKALSTLAAQVEASRAELAQLSEVMHGAEHDNGALPVARRKLSFTT